MSLGPHDTDAPRPPARSKGKLVAAGVLLAIPIIALMAVPTYSKEDPTLWGFPFFFWYQFLWVFICSAMTYGAYRLTLPDRRHDEDGDR